jgi:hypothetical protein
LISGFYLYYDSRSLIKFDLLMHPNMLCAIYFPETKRINRISN